MLSGTSMAAPLVAGQALLIIATVPSATPAQIRAVILHAATRDSLTGTHIDPDAPGSRVAHVPWLTTSTPASHFGTHTKTGAVINLFLSVPVSRPPMRLALDSVASSLHVALSRLSDARPGVRCDVAHAKASDGSGDVNLVCNVTSRRAYVKEVNEVVVEAFRRGAVRDVFERNVVLVLPPVVLTRGGVGALSVAGVVGIAVGVGVVVVIVVAVVCVAGVGRGRKKREEEV